MKTVFAKGITKKDKFTIVPVFKKGKAKYPKNIPLKGFDAKEGETVFLHTEKLLLLGLGEKKKFTAAKARELFAGAVKEVKGKKQTSISLFIIKDLEKYGQEIGEACGMANYTYAKFKTGKVAKELKGKEMKEIRVLGKLDGFKKGLQIAEAVNYTRDLVVGPANIVSTAYLANEAKKIAKKNGYKIKVLNRKQIKKMGMHAIIAVNDGSPKGDQEAKFVILEHNGASKKEKPIILVGKGLVFDTGGLNLKPSRAITDMQQDMAGGAAVLGTFQLLKKLKIKKNVVGLIPFTENSINAEAFRPNDILKTYSGKTVEVLNTDAEGRLILIDALAYADKKYKPEYIIDIATLTGACVVALGDRYAGLFGNDDKLIEKLGKAGKETDELVWHMPIHKDHKKTMESKIADLRNVEEGYNAASCTAAAFLSNFVGKNKWAHIDIAGTAFTKSPKKYETDKATGAGVRLFVKFLES
jgi:leucyl aminopeptidase